MRNMSSHINLIKNNFTRLINVLKSAGLVTNFIKASRSFVVDLFSLREGIRNFHSNNYQLIQEHIILGNFQEVRIRCKLLEIFSTLPDDAAFYRGTSYFMEGKFEQAKKHLLSYLNQQHGAHDSLAKYQIAVIEGDIAAITHIPYEILAMRYNSIASSYDSIVSNSWQDSVQFSIYLELKDYLTKHFTQDKKFSMLDLGCGTGIFGRFAAVDKLCSRIEGVDLAHNMLEIANSYLIETKSPYDNFVHGTIEDFFEHNNNKFEVVLLINTASFISNLKDCLSNCVKLLTTSGIIVMYFKHSTTPGDSFDLTNQAFLHDPEIVKELAHSLNLTVAMEKSYTHSDSSCGKLLILSR